MLVPWTLSEKKEFGLSLLCPSSLPSSLLPSTFQPPSPPQYTPVVYSGPDAGLTPVSVVSGSFSLSVFSPIAKILGKVGESLTRICCVRPPVERFTFVGKGAGLPFPGPSFFFLTSLNSSAIPHLLKFTY